MGKGKVKNPTICNDKRIFMREYQRIKREKGLDDAEILKMANACLDMFQIKENVLAETFDSRTERLNQIAVIAFCKAFGIAVDDREKEMKFEQKNEFLRIYDKVLNKGYGPSQIAQGINEYCHISQSTIDDTFSRKKHNLNTMVVLAFCRKYGCDIDKIYHSKGTGEMGCAPMTDWNDGETVNSELPNGFLGRFFGYFFNNTPDYAQQGKIDQFTLDISRHEITMTLRHFALNTANQYAPREIPMRGNLIYNQREEPSSGFFAIAFHSDDGKHFCTLAYNKMRLDGALYFRKGCMLSQSRDGTMPVIQSFVFTHKKLDLNIEENRKAIQGALALTNDTILVEKDYLDRFIDSEILQKYFKKASYQNALREYIELDEGIIRALNVCDKKELYKILLQIKSNAVTSRLFTFPNDSADRTWRYIAALCEEETLRQEEQMQL